VCVQCVYVSAYVDTQLAEQSYQYLTTGEDLRGLQEEPRSRHKVVMILFHPDIWIVCTKYQSQIALCLLNL